MERSSNLEPGSRVLLGPIHPVRVGATALDTGRRLGIYPEATEAKTGQK